MILIRFKLIINKKEIEMKWWLKGRNARLRALDCEDFGQMISHNIIFTNCTQWYSFDSNVIAPVWMCTHMSSTGSIPGKRKWKTNVIEISANVQTIYTFVKADRGFIRTFPHRLAISIEPPHWEYGAIRQWLKEANEHGKNNAEKMIGQTMYWLLQR